MVTEREQNHTDLLRYSYQSSLHMQSFAITVVNPLQTILPTHLFTLSCGTPSNFMGNMETPTAIMKCVFRSFCCSHIVASKLIYCLLQSLRSHHSWTAIGGVCKLYLLSKTVETDSSFHQPGPENANGCQPVSTLHICKSYSKPSID